MFENYLLVIDATGDAWPEERKRAVLLHALGTEGQRLFYTLPDTGNTYTTAVTALKRYFIPAVNVVAERHKFRQRTQRADETMNQFLAALRELAVACDFGEMEEQMLRDQLVERAANLRVRDRLLLEPDLTLNKAVSIAVQMETAFRNSELLSDTSQVRAIQSQRNVKRRDSKTIPSPSSDRSAANARQRRSCYRCGSNNHMANKPTCPAIKAVCNSCGKIGHFAKVCRSSQKQVREIVIPELTVLYMNDPKTVTDKILCSVQIKTKDGHCQPVELIVDTGSSVSILPESIYRKHFASCTLNPATVKLVSYSKEIIPVLGCFSTDVFHDGSTAMGTFYIVKSGSPLLGMDLLKALHCRIEGDAVITHENSEILPVHTVGCASGFVHKVKVKEGFIPVQQKLRRLPLSVRQAVSDDLKHLLEQDIIERVDASPWVSPIVVTQKRGVEFACALI